MICDDCEYVIKRRLTGCPLHRTCTLDNYHVSIELTECSSYVLRADETWGTPEVVDEKVTGEEKKVVRRGRGRPKKVKGGTK